MPSVLLVDDEPAMLEAIGNGLGGRGWDVTTCANGTDAVAQAERRRFDLVLSDVVMEGLVGVALAGRIHATRGNHDTPIMFMSNMAERRVRTVIPREYAFIAKPFSIDALMATIEAAMERVGAWAGSLAPSERLRRDLHSDR